MNFAIYIRWNIKIGVPYSQKNKNTTFSTNNTLVPSEASEWVILIQGKRNFYEKIIIIEVNCCGTNGTMKPSVGIVS